MVIDEKVKAIMDWQEAVTAFSDDYFFEIVRIYLGPIKTPFNKQNVIKSLALFLQKSENKSAIISLLDSDDCRILSAVKMLEPVSVKQLRSFFLEDTALKNIHSPSDFYERLANLEDRLIVYHVKNESETVLKINPFLSSELAPVLRARGIFVDSDVAEVKDSPKILTPEFFAAVISYVQLNRDICKQDGTFKRRAQIELPSVFGEENVARIQLFLRALRGLGILKEDDRDFILDWEKLFKFAELDFFDACIFLCCGAAGHFSRSSLYLFADILKTTWNCVQKRFFKKETLVQAVSLIMRRKNDGSETPSRFSSMMSKVFTPSLESDAGYSERFVDAAIQFGLFSLYGISEDGSGVYCSDSRFLNDTPDENLKCISIDAANRVTVMPGLPLKELLKLVRFLQIRHYDTAAVFEITKQSVRCAFDFGCNDTKIFAVLDRHSLFDIPQNLRINIQDWLQSYSSGSFYEGFVLKVDSKSEAIVESNPKIKNHIYEKLAPGVYLLNFENREQAASVIKNSGLDFIGPLKNPASQTNAEPLAYHKLPSDYSYEGLFSLRDEAGAAATFSRKDVTDELKKVLDSMNVTKDQYECLLNRIENNLIVNKEQLRADSVRFERTEATAMDHTGKIHVLESAIESASLVRIVVDGFKNELLARPILVDKKTQDAGLLLFDTETEEERRILVRHIIRIKKIRTPFGTNPKSRW